MISLSSLSQGTIGGQPSAPSGNNYGDMSWGDALAQDGYTAPQKPMNFGDVASQVPSAIGSLAETSKQNTENIQSQQAKAVVSDVQGGANDFQASGDAFDKGNVGEGLKQVGKGLVEGGLGTLSNAIQFFFAPATAGVQTMTDTIAGNNPNAKGISDIPAVQKFATGGAGNAMNDIQTAVSKAAQAHPVLAKALNDAFVVATTAAGAGSVDTAGDAAINKSAIETGYKPEPTGFEPKPATPTPAATQTTGTLASRIKDATPDYNPKMVGTNVKNSAGEIVPRIAGEGKGLNGERPVTTSGSEIDSGTELNNIKDYPDKGTNLEKQLAIDKAISTEAQSMRSGLQAEDKASPLDASTEKIKVGDIVKSNLPPEIREKIGYLSPEDEAKLSPNAKIYRQAQISNQEETMPKTAAGRYYRQVLDAVDAYDGTRQGKLDLRQAIDTAYKNARGKLAFGSDSGNVIDETNTDIRNGLNKDLTDTTKNTDIQASLQRQTNLYRASDTITAKARAESATAFGRIEQKYPTLRMVARQLQRQGVLIPLHIVEGAAGVTALGAILRKMLSGK